MSANHTDRGQSENITDFSQCHSGIVKKLDMLGELPGLLEPAARARQIAESAIDFFREAIFEHHLDEERELFSAVAASAAAGEERERVLALNKRLTDEHRVLERLWKSLESGLKKVAKGQGGDINVGDIRSLVMQYKAHAEFEEQAYLPLAQEILGRNDKHMAALGMSLHMRHHRLPTSVFHV